MKARYLISLIVIILIANLIFGCYFPSEWGAVIGGSFVVIAAVTAALLAMDKYHTEQTIARLQRIYFDETLLGQEKSLEDMMSQTTKNVAFVRQFHILACHLIRREQPIEILKRDLENIFSTTANQIAVNLDTADFKKETIAILLHGAKVEKRALPTWIKEFQDDFYGFSSFLKAKVLIIKPDLSNLNESNLGQFAVYLENNQKEVEDNYIIIRRHYILFSLFTRLVLNFISVHYSSVKNIFSAFEDESIEKIIALIDESYKELMADFYGVKIGEVSPVQKAMLEERMKCAYGKIARLQIKFK